MKREILCIIVHLVWACYCQAQDMDDRILVAQSREAAASVPAPLARSNPAPASGDQKLQERVKSIEASLGVLARKVDAYAAMKTQLTPDQDKRLTALEVKVAEIKKTIAEANANAAKQPTLAAAPAKDHVCNCGPNCRCVGMCNCRWAGECLGVPDSRVQRSVVTQPATQTVRYYSAPVRTYSQPTVRYYSAPRYQYHDMGTYWYTTPTYGGNCVNGVCY